MPPPLKDAEGILTKPSLFDNCLRSCIQLIIENFDIIK